MIKTYTPRPIVKCHSVLIWRGKHDPQTFSITSDEQLFTTALYLLEYFKKEWQFYDSGSTSYEFGDGSTVNQILRTQDGPKAWRFLRYRSQQGHQYEDVSLHELVTILPKEKVEDGQEESEAVEAAIPSDSN